MPRCLAPPHPPPPPRAPPPRRPRAVADLLAANPDLGGEGALQPNDLIALPLPAVPPRLYALRPGDGARGVARRFGVPLGRLLARNPALRDAGEAVPGYVVLIPGLRGDSEHLSGGGSSAPAGGGGAAGGGDGGAPLLALAPPPAGAWPQGGGLQPVGYVPRGGAAGQEAQYDPARARPGGGGGGGGGGGAFSWGSPAAARRAEPAHFVHVV